MPNTFTTTTKTGYGTRIGRSFGGVITGILMFVCSFGVLYWNEGRVDISKIAKTAIELPADSSAVDASAQGQLVSATGVVTSDETLGDGLYLKPGKYLTLDRKVEMYAWVEKQSSSTDTNLGGSETTTTTYDYVKEWVTNPAQPTDMKYPEEHINPALTLAGDSLTVKNLTVGSYKVSGDVGLPGGNELALNKDMVNITYGSVLSGNYIFKGTGTSTAPNVGDLRVSYTALAPGFEGTVFGKLSGSSISKYSDEDGNTLYTVYEGSRAGAIASMHKGYVMTGWVLRLVGFAMMWFGLLSILGPLSTILDVLPILGSGSRFVVSLVTFPIALVLSIVTIVVSMILHSIVALIIAMLVLIGVAIAAAKMWPRKAAGAV
jgi:hypothetical protein